VTADGLTLGSEGDQISIPTSAGFSGVITTGDTVFGNAFEFKNGNGIVLVSDTNDSGATGGVDATLIARGSSATKTALFDVNGNINFYEDTGTTAKLEWLASDETLKFADNSKAVFGAGSDLQLYHSGSHSYIIDNGTGDLKIYGANIEIGNASGVKNLFATSGGATTLYFNNAAKLATTSTGIDVTGTTVTDGLTSAGDAAITGSSSGSTVLTLTSNALADTPLIVFQRDGGAVAGKLAYEDTNTAMAFGTTTSHELKLLANNTRAIQIDSGGDVSLYEDTGTTAKFFWDASAESLGIGTSSPSKKLSVKADGGGSQLGIDIHNEGTATGDDAVISFETQGSREFTMGLDRSATSFVIAESSTLGSNQRLVIDDSGNVGIGTQSPRYNAEVSSSSNTFLQIASTSTSALTGLLFGDTSNAVGRVTYDHSDNSLQLFTNTTEKMRIDSSGNVGIGTSSLGSGEGKLAVLGSNGTGGNGQTLLAKFGGNSAVQSRALQLTEYSIGGINNVGFDFNAPGAGSQAAISFSTLSSERMRIDSSGNLGIGNPSPSAKFTNYKNTSISGSAGATLSLEDDSQPRMLLTSDSATSYISSFNDNPITFSVTSGNFSSSTGTERMRIDSSGNLLVGQTSAGVGTVGGTMYADGTGKFTVDGSIVAYLNRLTSDGTILSLRKDTTEVGSIGAVNGDLLIGTGDTGLRFHDGDNRIYPINTSGGSKVDATIDLGDPTGRFKDLYLSGRSSSVGITNYTNALRLESLDTSVAAEQSIGDIEFVANDSSTGGTGVQAKISAVADNAFGTAYALTFQTGTAASPSEKVRIDSSGNLLVGGSSGGTGVTLIDGGRIRLDRAGDWSIESGYGGGTSGAHMRILHGGTQVGSITSTASATAYNTSSDQRLKDNIVDAPSASDDIDAIQVRSFDWKADGSHQKYGMVAQELQSVAPEAVSGDADSDDMMGVDYSKLVPMLVKEIQSLRARVAQLEGAN